MLISLNKTFPSLILLAMLSVLVACSGEGSGGDKTELLPDPEPPVEAEPQTFIVENEGGGEALQQALNQAEAGDTVIIRAGAASYTSAYRFPGESLRGFTLTNSGTDDAPIRIIGEAASGFSRPVIDQGQTAAHDPTASGANAEPTAGLFLLCASHVQIENLEIRNVHLAGITTSLGACETQNIRIANSHIHHVYGDRNVAAIRLSRASEVTIYNNELHDVYQTDSNREQPLVSGDNQQIDSIRIEHNRLSNMHTGVRLQAQHDKSIQDVMIAANHMEGLDTAVNGITTALDESTPAGAQLSMITVTDNLLMHSVRGIVLELGVSEAQSSGLDIFNNTFYQFTEAPIRLTGMDGVSLYNNIFSHIDRDLLITTAPANSSLVNAIAEYDYNLYWHPDYSADAGPEWLLDAGGNTPQVFATFNLWQQAYTDTLHAQLLTDPDQSSQFIDPLFVDVAAGDFSPALPFAQNGGRNGEALGAFRSNERPGLE